MKRTVYHRVIQRLVFTDIIFLFLLTALPAVRASAFVVPDTGQKACYDNRGRIACRAPGESFFGQDADYRGPEPSFRDNGDGTATDLNTGLIWQKNPAKKQFTFQQAGEYAIKLELAGHDDWRLPTIKELYSLIDFSGDMNTGVPFIDTSVFGYYHPNELPGNRFMDGQYWSDTVYVGRTMFGNYSVFGVNFADGRIKAYPAGQGRRPAKRNFVRCVRSDPGYGENRFKDNGDGTITDLASGLMWQKADSGRPMKWEQAISYAERLSLAGHNDWRLPNAKELQSIVDYTRAPDALAPGSRGPAIDPVFVLTQTESWYWTGTTLAAGPRPTGIYVCFGQALAYDRRTGKFTNNAHGAGAQRSDPKEGDPRRFPQGRGPQADQIRIYNYVRAVRNAD